MTVPDALVEEAREALVCGPVFRVRAAAVPGGVEAVNTNVVKFPKGRGLYAITSRSTAASTTFDGGVQTRRARCSVIQVVSRRSDSPANANVAGAVEVADAVDRGTGTKPNWSRSSAANDLRTVDHPVFPIPKCCRTSRMARLFSALPT